MVDQNRKQFEIKKLIKERSPFDESETNRIIAKFFSSITSDIKILTQHYQFDEKKVLDIGCSYGQSLLYWREDSEGIEVQEYSARFVSSLGRVIHKLNIEDGLSGLEKEHYDAVYCNNLFEHLISPHLFLVRLHFVLKAGGILAIGHPVVPPFPFRNLWKLLRYRGWLAVEHVNFFTAETSKLTLSRAGFEVINQHYLPRFLRLPILSKLSGLMGLDCLSVCRRIDEFKYAPKRGHVFDPSWASDLRHFRQ